MGKYKKSAFALTAKPIPYYKDLRILAGSVTSAILFQQLEYWFSVNRGAPFYKFLSPPGASAIGYKDGDSWTEELGFSENEFRDAFKRIGVAYKSKKEFDEARKNSKTFKTKREWATKQRDKSVEDTKWIVTKHEEVVEKMYCSYHNKIKGQTTYIRNDDFVEMGIRKLTELTSVDEQS